MGYINAEKLKTELNKRIELLENGDAHPEVMKRVEGIIKGYKASLSIIDSLQQEQSELPGIEESGIPGKDYIPVEWVDACEKYGKWKIVKQEPPEVDIKKELYTYICSDEYINTRENGSLLIAKHFYELGLKARNQ